MCMYENVHICVCIYIQEAKHTQFQELAQLMRDLLDRRRQIMSKTLPRVSLGVGGYLDRWVWSWISLESVHSSTRFSLVGLS